MIAMKPFWQYYGAKFRIAPRYPAPEYQTIVEPFAGAAGYSIRYSERRVILVDANPVITGLWRYLIRVSEREILELPARVDHVDDVKAPQEAKWLIGFWLNVGESTPRKVPSKWARETNTNRLVWGDKVKERVASQVSRIRHWKVIDGDYTKAPRIVGTWFIDPPYNNHAGRRYSSQVTDFVMLGAWCKRRQGQVMVCENEGADWLPFRPFHTSHGMGGRYRTGTSTEVLWTNKEEQ